MSRESTPRAASPVPEAQDAGSDAESWETGSTHHDDARSTASDESWATEANERRRRSRGGSKRSAATSALPLYRRRGRLQSKSRRPRPSPGRAGRRGPSSHHRNRRRCRRIGQQAARSHVPHGETPAARVAREAAGLQPREAAPAAVFAAGAAVAAAAVAARVADGVVLPGDPSRDSPGRDAPIPELATPAEVIDEINRVRRDPAAYAAFLRSHVAPRYRLDGSYWPREAARAAAPDARRAGGLFACCVLFFFEVPSRPSRLRPIAAALWPLADPTAEPTAEPTSRYSDVAAESTPSRRGRVDARVAGEEAIAELDALGADCLPPLKAHVGMTRAAEDHVEDLVRTKRLGHTGSDGSAPAQRLNRHGRWFERASECLSHGRRTAVAAVAQMIIDDGVASRAQRRGLLSDRARAVGCAIGCTRGTGRSAA